eukprot:4886642-Amphidinium_carterae.2
MFRINGDKASRGTSLPTQVGEYMELNTTFKCNKQRIINDGAIYKTEHFHDFSIITTTEHYVPNYIIEMIKFYLQKQKQQKSRLFVTKTTSQPLYHVHDHPGCADNELKKTPTSTTIETAAQRLH